MKIGPIDMKPAPTTTAADRKGPAAPVSATEPSARVELSSQAALAGSDASRADFDSEKVERIAQAIRDGKFQVNANAIADKLIANAQELLPKAAH
jgi:negative regulator of flagellin synthesis FlgM